MISGEFPDDCPWLAADRPQLADRKEAGTPLMAWVGLGIDFSLTSDPSFTAQLCIIIACGILVKHSRLDLPQRL